MADIELVVKMPEEIQLALINNIQLSIDQQSICDSYIKQAIINGTPLPKGHGRIADMDAAIKCIEDVEGEDAIWAISLIEWACSKRTIIEADKESEDKDEN